MRKKISFKYPFILSILTASFLLSGSGYGNDGYFAHPYAEDDRLEFLEKNTYSSDIPENNGNFYLIDENRYFYSCALRYRPTTEYDSYPYYSDELYFDRGYQAEYKGDLLMNETAIPIVSNRTGR